ncbi:MAG TPA: acyltransferase [Nocardioidaceae bacterium]|nr:acyltransferase [Nocardioidaceae bacterium]
MFGRPRDPRQVRFLTWSSLRWMVRNRAWTPYYLVRYWRFFLLRIRRPDVVTEGFCFLGRKVEVYAKRGRGRIVLGRFVHLGDRTKLRAHEGTLRVGDKVVFGGDNTVNCLLDIEIGSATLIADWVYICDFDHVTDDVSRPIKDQGVVKTPVRIGPDGWLGVKSTVLRGAWIGRGCVVAAHSIVRDGKVPDYAIVAGTPATVVKDRREGYEAHLKLQAYLEELNASSQPPW